MTRKLNRNGVILWEGASAIDGKPIVAVLTGLARKSENEKTGNMLQTWIVRSDVNPVQAINDGSDLSICGACPLRGIIGQMATTTGVGFVNRMRSCYVKVSQAPRGVYSCYRRGGYRHATNADYAKIADRFVRFGSYGDPAAVPYRIWRRLSQACAGHTGYTHQWRIGRFWRFRGLLMASVETTADAATAWAMGWRTFRTMPQDAEPELGEFRCPASKEAGNRLDCARCGACKGQTASRQGVSVAINVHGSPSVLGIYRRRILPVLNA